MNKWVKIILAVVVIALLIFVMKFFADKNAKAVVDFLLSNLLKQQLQEKL